MNELQNKKMIAYSLSYFTNIMYIILIAILGYGVSGFSGDPVIAIIIIVVGTTTTMCLSTIYLRNQEFETLNQTQMIVRLAFYHLFTIVTLVIALSYMFVLS